MMECIPYGDHRLQAETWVDAHQKEYYREGCRCTTCSTHREMARKKGRCSQFCAVCFDGILATFGPGVRSGKRLTEE
jgi:hypothetical protein